MQELCAHARGVGERQAVGAVLVDYLQLVRPPEGQYDRRDIEVSQVARRLKALAVELNCPVVAAAQIGRQAAQQSERVPAGDFNSEAVRDAIRRRRPQLHHLREGGSEQEADVVLGLLNYRADYLEDQERTDPQERNRPGPLEVLVLENRFGELGLATLILEGPDGNRARHGCERRAGLVLQREFAVEGPDYEATASPSPKYPARPDTLATPGGRILRSETTSDLVVRPLQETQPLNSRCSTRPLVLLELMA